MKEIRAIIEAYDAIDQSATGAALATVVRVKGSSYRRTGARMLVLDNGTWVGGISGGCLEGDALKRARVAIARSVSTLITYDTTDNDEYQIGVGLGCNGIIDVLFTPLDFSDKNNQVEILKCCIAANRETHVLITITALEGNWNLKTGQVIKYTGYDSLRVFNNPWLEEQFTDAINKQLSSHKSLPQNFLLSDERVIDSFVEILPPEINMVIMGYQYDVYPLTRLLKEIGWRVTIVASLQKLNLAIINIADEVVASENFGSLTIDKYTAIILMSHDYKTDKFNLPKALATGAPYIGILGPRERAEKIKHELAAEGKPVAEEDLNRIHAPIGLDIGAVTPEEIAMSLIAEVRAFLSNRDGGSLRLRKSSIHERD